MVKGVVTNWTTYWSYKSCKAPVTSPTTNQHPVFLQARCPSCRPTNSVKELKGKISHSIDLLTPSYPGGLSTCIWPLIAPTYLGVGLPCLSSALWCQYPTAVSLLWIYSFSMNRRHCCHCDALEHLALQDTGTSLEIIRRGFADYALTSFGWSCTMHRPSVSC